MESTNAYRLFQAESLDFSGRSGQILIFFLKNGQVASKMTILIYPDKAKN